MREGDIDAPTKISTFTQKRETSNPDGREKAGKASWRRRPLLTLEGPEDEPGKEVWGGHPGGRTLHVLSLRLWTWGNGKELGVASFLGWGVRVSHEQIHKD